MIHHWIGAGMIIIACCGCAALMAAAYRREEQNLRQLQQILEWMECELTCRVPCLSQLFREGAGQSDGVLNVIFEETARELDKRVAPDALCCIMAAINLHPQLTPKVKDLLITLGKSLGDFDLSGQLRQFAAVQTECSRILQDHTKNRDNHIRSIQTLGLCAGFALAILLL